MSSVRMAFFMYGVNIEPDKDFSLGRRRGADFGLNRKPCRAVRQSREPAKSPCFEVVPQIIK